jgi:uncharacterized protein (TIGR02246 family)
MTTLDRETEVKDLFDRSTAAWDANDADAFAALYTEDASVVTSVGVSLGREAVRAFMSAGFEGRLKGTKAVENLNSVRFVGGDVAIVDSVSAFVLPGETSVRPGMERRATYVLDRTGGDWRIAAYHNCAIG